MSEAPNRLFDLLVEHPAVGYDDNGIEGRLSVELQPDELVSEPRNRIAFAAAGGVLDEIALAYVVGRGGIQQPVTTRSW